MATVLSTRDLLLSKPYIDPDRAAYGEAASSSEVEYRVAATPAYSGTLVERITSINQIVEAMRTGRQLDPLQATTNTANDANVAVATYSTTNPTGYSGNNLEVQATGGVSTTRGSRKTCAVGAQSLAVFEGGQWIRLQRRVTSNTNLTRWVIRFEFATTSDWAEYELAPAAVTINTWAEVVFAKGNPRATNGTVNWALWSGKVWIGVVASAAYTGNCEVRDLRIGTVQTAKDTPDGAFAWETSLDLRARYRDNATAKITPTTLAAASSIGATNVKVTSVTGMAIGDELTIETAGLVETRTITTVGTAGAGGTGITVGLAFSYAHGSGDAVAVYYWGPWSGVPAIKVSQPPTVAASSPADAATITDPTPALVHTFSSPAGKAQASARTDLYRRAGFANLAAGLAPVSAWRLSEPSGTFADTGSGAIAGTANGTMTRGAVGLLSPADADAAIDLDGSTGYVTFGDVYDFPALAPFSVAFLMRPDATSGRLVSKEGTDGWRIFFFGNTVLFDRHTGAGSDAASAASVSTTGTTAFVVATYDGAQLLVYLNGVAGTPVASTRSLGGNANPLTIGRQANSSASYFDGRIDEVRIWSRALSGSEVAALQAARTEAYGNQIARSTTVPGTDLSVTLPRFLLEPARAYAWQKVATDTDGLSGATALRTFVTNLSAPAAATNLVATPNADDGTITLAWDASSDPDLDHYRVYWQDGAGSWIRVDGGPEALDDGRPALSTNAFVFAGGRLGENSFTVTVHDGVLESDETGVTATLSAPVGAGSWMTVDEGDGRYTRTLRVLGAPRVRESVVERFAPPGRGSTIHLTWGLSARKVTLRATYRPATDGDLAGVYGELQASGLGTWLKAPGGWLWDPIWCVVVGVSDSPGVGGWSELTLELEEAER